MSFELADERKQPNVVVLFLQTIDKKKLQDEVLARSGWGSNPIDDVIAVLIETAGG